MENKSVVVLFFILLVVFVFSFTLSLDAISNNQVLYGTFALIGFILLVFVSLFETMLLSKEGMAVSYWFKSLSVISLIILVWYVTRAGTLFGWW